MYQVIQIRYGVGCREFRKVVYETDSLEAAQKKMEKLERKNNKYLYEVVNATEQEEKFRRALREQYERDTREAEMDREFMLEMSKHKFPIFINK